MTRKAIDLRQVRATLDAIKSHNTAARRAVITNITTYQSPLGLVTIPEDD